MKLTGAQVLIQCLKEQGVDTIFGFPGGAVLPIYDALLDSDLTHILTSHEQGATHGADGYARATGRVGVVFATSGPGATNTVTGIATAYMDSVPMVVFTGQVSLDLLGKDSFQEVDITGITMPITKHNFIVKDAQALPDIIRKAFDIARSGRPGPVLVDIPKDIQTAVIDYRPRVIDTSNGNKGAHGEFGKQAERLENGLKAAVEVIRASERPVVFTGGGVIIANAHRELTEFAQKLKAPVVTSLMGLGAFPADHPQYLGLVGMHGSRYANYTVSNCDLIVAVGVRFSDRVIGDVSKFAPSAKIIHIDIDPAELGKNIETHIPLNGDVKVILSRLVDMIEEKRLDDWNKRVEEWKRQYPLKYTDDGSLKPQFILSKLYQMARDNYIITTEVGQHQIWAAQYFNYSQPRTFISSGGLGTMGYGLGAAIGAQVGCPHKRVINIAGDGSFRMNANELATVARYKLPIIEIIMNNSALGMVRQWQHLFFNKRFSNTTLGGDVDFVKLAQAYNIKGMRLDDKAKVEEVLKEALDYDGPVLIECIIDRDEKVFPIVPPGAPIADIIDE
ncbi:MAG TPA: biosynthetic-type acetolactate synthase large subunit [Clostridiales bacterium]|nr:biosynthetic-type acetolactate synthase large subunit [Clostridiales bacterium]